MARKTELRWTKNRKLEIRKQVLNYNRRLKRAQEKYPSAQLPEPLKPSAVIEAIKMPQQYRNVMNDLQAGTAEKFKPTPTGQIPYLQMLEQRQKRRKSPVAIIEAQGELIRRGETKSRKELLKDIDLERRLGRIPTERDFLLKSIGLKPGQSYDEMGKLLDEWLTDINVARTEQWRDNYLKTIKQQMDIVILSQDYDSYSLLSDLYTLIAQMPLENFLIAQLVNPQQLAIGTLLDSRGPGNLSFADLDVRREVYEELQRQWVRFV